VGSPASACRLCLRLSARIVVRVRHDGTPVDIVFLVDVTGSMSPVIDAALGHAERQLLAI
jgi:hypothetical protein